MILAIDTSGSAVSAVVVDGETIICSDFQLSTQQHSTMLLPMISRLDFGKYKLTGIAVTCGPGSFTGLRIGVATAMGLSYGLKLPLYYVPTLDALAYGTIGRVCAAIDARRGEYYTALYEDGERVSDYLLKTHDEATKEPQLVCGHVDAISVGFLAQKGKVHEGGLIYVRPPQAIRELCT